MNRRHMMGSFGLATATLALNQKALARLEPEYAGEPQEHEHHAQTKPMLDCAEQCAETVKHCLTDLKQGASDLTQTITLLETASGCAELCLLGAKLEAEGSPLASITHAAVADACKLCAETCEKHPKDSPIVNHCMLTCRTCEQHCRSMAGRHARNGRGAATRAESNSGGSSSQP